MKRETQEKNETLAFFVKSRGEKREEKSKSRFVDTQKIKKRETVNVDEDDDHYYYLFKK